MSHEDNPADEDFNLGLACEEINSLKASLGRLTGFVATCKLNNTREWMAMLADELNKALESLADEDRVKWPGYWASELEILRNVN